MDTDGHIYKVIGAWTMDKSLNQECYITAQQHDPSYQNLTKQQNHLTM